MNDTRIPLKPEFVSEMSDFLGSLRLDVPLRISLKKGNPVFLSGLKLISEDDVDTEDIFLSYSKKGLLLESRSQNWESSWALSPREDGIEVREVKPFENMAAGNAFPTGGFLEDMEIDEVAEVEAQFLMLKDAALILRKVNGVYGKEDQVSLTEEQAIGLLSRKQEYQVKRLADHKSANVEGNPLNSPDKKG